MSATDTIEYRKDWGTSKAKAQLKQDILEKRIDGWAPKDVYQDPKRFDLYKHYKYENFRNNLRELRNAAGRGLHRVQRDYHAYTMHVATYMPPDNCWHRSAAQKLLRQLVQCDEIDGMEPSKI